MAAPAPQAPLSPKRVSSSSSSSSSNIPEGYTCLTSSDGRKYYMHHASGRCSLPAPPAHSPCLLRMPGSIAAAAAAASRAAQGDVVCARDRASCRRGQGGRGGEGYEAVFVLLMLALQLEQLFVSGVPREQAGGSYVASLLRMALLGVMCAYAYLWLRAKFA